MTKKSRFASILALAFVLTACARTEPMQPDRSVFNIDATYQRARYDQPIAPVFDRTVAVFRDAGYRMNIVDRATGQISGQRGKMGDKGTRAETDLRFYALVLPDGDGSQVALRIVQIASQGIPVLTQSRTEVVLNQPDLYAYIFRRIAGDDAEVSAKPLMPTELRGDAQQ